MALIGHTNTIICLLLLHLSYNKGIFVSGISTTADFEFENQLKILNKLPVKTIKGKAGDLFDCINIHEQPAFDHPLLQNHKIQMTPTFVPQESAPRSTVSSSSSSSSLPSSSSAYKVSSVMLKDGGCPQGTVPIRRTTKEDLIRAKAFSELYGSSIHPMTPDIPGRHVAAVQTQNHATIRYNGVQASINVQNPTLTSNWSNSAAYMYIGNTQNDVMVAGWSVAPALFGDSQTRFTINWSNGKSECYNLLCPGFVQVDPKRPIGAILSPTSTYGGKQYIFPLSIYKDTVTGNWWLASDDQTIHYGYWPGTLFPSLVGGSHLAGWMGTTWAPVHWPSSQMGSGHFPDGDYHHAAFYVFMKVIDGSNKPKIPDLTRYYTDQPKCFGVSDFGFQGPDKGYTMMFGGPGGQCGN